MITPDQALYILLGAAAGGFINGLAAFGTALFALGFFLSVMPPVQAVAITVVLAVASGVQGVWLVRHAIQQNSRRLMRFLVPGIVGVPLGVWSLHMIDVTMLKLLIAFFLILYGIYFSWRTKLPQIRERTPIVDASIGLIGGVLGGAASLSGAVPTMWCTVRGWPKMETRAVLQPFNMVILTLTAGMLAWGGAFTPQTFAFLLIALPMAMVAAQVGIWVFKRITDAVFRRLLISLTLLSGVVLLLRELI